VTRFVFFCCGCFVFCCWLHDVSVFVCQRLTNKKVSVCDIKGCNVYCAQVQCNSTRERTPLRGKAHQRSSLAANRNTQMHTYAPHTCTHTYSSHTHSHTASYALVSYTLLSQSLLVVPTPRSYSPVAQCEVCRGTVMTELYTLGAAERSLEAPS
jgi:hypothetical protein